MLVVLGDPGAGKTEAFKKAADEEDGGLYLPVRAFLNRSPESYRESVLYLDALDESRARHADGGTALQEILRRLDQIGRPKFRLSCRASDWLGSLDTDDLKAVSPDGKVTVLQLEPLTEEDIAAIAGQTIDDPEDFIHQARTRGIFEWLQNPQSLGLILKVVGRGNWPETKTELYEKACHLLAQESNEVHSRTGRGQIAEDAVLEAAGHLCAVHLCGGTAGFALERPASDDDFPYIGVIGDDYRPTVEAAGRRKLFRAEGPERIVPVHRTLAEYLAAGYLVRLIRKGLPIGRAVSLLLGSDLGVLSEMRGLFAWLACLCPEHSSYLLGTDPLGIVLYGDPAALPSPDKVLLFKELVALAQRDPRFRSENWTAVPFGALAVPELRPLFEEILSDSRQPIQLVDCVLDALAYGTAIPELGGLLLAIVRDSQRPSVLRGDALAAYRTACPDQLKILHELLKDIQEGRLDDPDDELRGYLLEALFPGVIGISEVLDFLVEGNTNFGGRYWGFLHSGLLDRAGDLLPELLDTLAASDGKERSVEAGNWRLRGFLGQVLLRGVETLGTQVPIAKLYHWLGIPLRSHGSSVLDYTQQSRLREWLKSQPQIVQDLFLHLLAVAPPDDLQIEDIQFWRYRCPTVYPPRFGTLLLRLVDQNEDERVRDFLVRKAARLCFFEEDPEAPEVEELWSFVESRQSLRQLYYEENSCRIEEWRWEEARHRREQKDLREKNCQELLSRIEGIRSGTDLQALIFLADVYFKEENRYSGEKTAPEHRIEREFGKEVSEAAKTGLVNLIRFPSQPGPPELATLEVQGKYFQVARLGKAVLAGMDLLWMFAKRELLELPPECIGRALVHQILRNKSLDLDWVHAILVERSSVVAESLQEFWGTLLSHGRSKIPGLTLLWYDKALADLAGDLSLRLLVEFPKIEPDGLKDLLYGALLHGERSNLLRAAREKLARKRALGKEQRTQWLTTAFLLAPDEFARPLQKSVSRVPKRLETIANFVSPVTGAAPELLEGPWAIECLARMFGTAYSPKEPLSVDEALVSEPNWRITELVSHWISLLGSDFSSEAHSSLFRLQQDGKLAAWRPTINHTLALQARRRREAEFSHSDVEQVVRTLRNGAPANAADLQALVCDHLRTLVNEIRNAPNDAYKSFWNIDSNERPVTPRPENDCRNRLLDRLRPLLLPLRVSPEPEGHYADQKRGDIKFLSGPINIPAEVKVHTHRELWTAIPNQLIPRYMRDPGAGKLGVFIGFWFGVEAGSTPRPPAGITPPQNAEQLRLALLETIPAGHKGHVEVIVFDVSPREKPRKKAQAAKRPKKANGSTRSGAKKSRSAR